MKYEFKMPKMGFSEGDVTVNEWLKKAGDEVKEGDPVVEVQGEKLTNELEAEKTGTITEILVEEGTAVPIGTVLYTMEV